MIRPQERCSKYILVVLSMLFLYMSAAVIMRRKSPVEIVRSSIDTVAGYLEVTPDHVIFHDATGPGALAAQYDKSSPSPPRTGKKRMFVAFFGLKNRDRGCALDSQRRMIAHLESEGGYEVETHGFEHLADSNELVDSAKYDPAPGVCNYHFCHLSQQKDVRSDVKELCKTRNCELIQTHYHKQKANAYFQLHDEWSVGKYLREHGEEFALALVVNSDYWLSENLHIDQVKEAEGSVTSVFTPSSNDFGGVGNGVYMGHPKPVAAFLNRWENPPKEGGTWPKTGTYNYETQVKRGLQEAGLTRQVIRSYQSIMSSYVKIRHKGGKTHPNEAQFTAGKNKYKAHWGEWYVGGKPLNVGFPESLKECLENIRNLTNHKVGKSRETTIKM